MKVLIVGDYVPRNRLAEFVENNDYGYIFGEITEIVRSVDYSVINLEAPIVDDSDIPIDKCGPNLRCSANGVKTIACAGFKCATLANNHIRDYGDSAVKRTIKTLENFGLDYVGAGSNHEEAAKVLYKNIAGVKLAIINCCENEFSIATNHQYGANPLNPIKQFYSIQEAKSNADYVIVVVHGGHEHYQLPSPRMQDTYRFFVDSGADLVVNHHQHCYSGYEIYNGKPIVYGTGNFCMDKNPVRIGQIWNYGYMVLWDTTYPDNIQVIPYNQCGEKPTVHLLDKNSFNETLGVLNAIIANREELEERTARYYGLAKKNIHSVLEPIQNRVIAGLQRRHLLPSLVTRKWLLKLHDFILCESHRDKMEYYFKNNNK